MRRRDLSEEKSRREEKKREQDEGDGDESAHCPVGSKSGFGFLAQSKQKPRIWGYRLWLTSFCMLWISNFHCQYLLHILQRPRSCKIAIRIPRILPCAGPVTAYHKNAAFGASIRLHDSPIRLFSTLSLLDHIIVRHA